MALSALELKAVQDLAKALVDVIIPEVIAAEEDKLPLAYQAPVKLILAAVLPQIEAALDAKIGAM